jgi:DNA-binding beta-propeller fold protein YncE
MSGISTKLMSRAVTGINPAWDLDYASFDDTKVLDAWDGTATLERSYSTGVTLRNVWFSSDGSKMAVCEQQFDNVRLYSLGTPWEMLSAGTTAQALSIGTYEAQPTGVWFRDDGTKMYIIGFGSDRIKEFTLDPAWNLASAVFSVQSAAFPNNPEGIWFSADGGLLFKTDSGTDNVSSFELNPAWDINARTPLQTLSVVANSTQPRDLFVSPDGLRLSVINDNPGKVVQYNMTTAFDLSTATFDREISVVAQGNAPQGVFWKYDGVKLYVGNGQDVDQYRVGTYGLPIGTAQPTPTGVFFRPDGFRLYTVGQTNDRVNQWHMSVPWDISTAVQVDFFYVGSQETAPTGLSFRPDGTKMYVIGTTGDDVNEYDLASAWNVSTAVYLQTFSVATEENAPKDVKFGKDGTKMYVIGNADTIFEYDVLTAWDVSTAVLSANSLSVLAEDTNPHAFVFRTDGKRLFVAGRQGRAVLQYRLTEAWNVGSAIFDKEFVLPVFLTGCFGMDFSSDGLSMYIVNQNDDMLYRFNFALPA